MLVGPLVLLIYEPLIGTVRWRDSAGFVVRIGRARPARLALVDRAAGAVAPLRDRLPPVHRAAALDLGHQQRARGAAADGATGPPTSAWASTASTGRCSARPARCCSTRWLVGASLLLPALALGGFIWTRRWRYAPVPAAACCSSGWRSSWPAFPSGHAQPRGDGVGLPPRRRSCASCAPPRRRRRWSRSGWRACSAWARSWPGRACARCAPAAAAGGAGRRSGGLAALIALAALPLVRGTAIEQQLTWKRIPAAWTDAGRGPRPRPAARTRARSCCRARSSPTTPGAAPPTRSCRALTDRPVAVRYETPYGDPHSTDLLWTVDRLVEPAAAAARPAAAAAAPDGRRRGRHGQRRRPLAQRRRQRRRRPPPSSPAQGLDRPRSYGPDGGRCRRARRARAGRATCPRCAATTSRGVRGIVHVDASGPATIVDGGARGPRGPGRVRRAAGEQPDPLRRRPLAGPAARAGRRGRRGGGHRLEPPPPLRAGVRPPEPGRHAAREGAARPQPRRSSTRSRSAAPTPRPSRC